MEQYLVSRNYQETGSGGHTSKRGLLLRKKRGMTSRTTWERLLVKSELSDLITGLDAVIGILTKGVINVKYASRLYRWATAVYHWVIAHGPALSTRMRAAKEYFTHCRQIAISGRFGDWGTLPRFPFRNRDENVVKRTALHQVSRVSRSLREADRETVLRSLKDHEELALHAFETPEDLKASFGQFLKFRFGGAVEGSLGAVGASSSYLSTKAQGGAPDEIRDTVQAFLIRKVNHIELEQLTREAYDLIPSGVKILNTSYLKSCYDLEGGRTNRNLPRIFLLGGALFPHDKSYEMDIFGWETVRTHLISVLACWSEINMGELPKCRQIAVVERGFKVRVATPLESHFRYLLGVINSGLLECLEKMPQVVSSLHGRPAEELDWTMGRRYGLVFSADLKSATDYFPHDLMSVAADVLSEGWPKIWADLLRRAVGPHEMTSADGERVITTRRGILMGSPVSWPLLSMYSAWLHSLSGSDGWFAVCGDDYIGCHNYTTYRRYLKQRARTGAIGSPGKDILGTQSIGVFAEELISVGRCRWIPTVSVRAILADPKSGKPGWSQGPEVAAALDVLNWTPVEKGRLCGRLHKSIYRQLRRSGIEPIGPRWVGSAGFPGVPPYNTLLRARRMISQSIDQVIAWIASLEMAWSETRISAHLSDWVLEEFEKATIEFSTTTKLAGEGDWGPIRDVLSSRISQLSWSDFLESAGESRGVRVTLGKLSRTIRDVAMDIQRRGRWLPAGSLIERGNAICTRLEEIEPRCRHIKFSSLGVKYVLRASDVERPPLRKRPATGPGSPSWGTRKRAKLSR